MHRGPKKVPHIDAAGRRVEPAVPNAIKFERFIFDLLPAAARAIVVEVDPAALFAPLKNASGQQAGHARSGPRQIVALHAEWLARPGAEVVPAWKWRSTRCSRWTPQNSRKRFPPVCGL